MTALSANRNTVQRDGEIATHDVAASTTIYQGGAVAINSSGYAAPAANTSGFRFVGMARAKVDNSSGSNGDKTVDVDRAEVLKWASSGLSQSDEGSQVWFSDDQTVSTTQGYCYAGRIVEVISATECWVDHSGALADFTAGVHGHTGGSDGGQLNPYTGIAQGRQGVPVTVTGGAGGLAAADLCYVSDVSSAVPVLLKAQATSAGKFAQFIVPSAIEADASGLAVTAYLLTSVDTSGGSVGDPVYLSDGTAGGWTLTKPTGEDKVQVVGRVAKSDASAGEILFLLPGNEQIVHTHADNSEGGLVPGTSVSVADAAGNLDATTVEAALAEIGNLLMMNGATELDLTTADEECDLIPASANPSGGGGLLLVLVVGYVTEQLAGDSEDQAVVTIYDGDDNSLGTITFADASGDAVGDVRFGIVLPAATAGDAAKIVPANKKLYAKVTTATSGAGAAGEVMVAVQAVRLPAASA